MATIIQYGTESYWGVNASLSGVFVTGQNFNSQVPKSELKNEKGRVMGVTYYDQTLSLSADVTVLLPSSGSQTSRAIPASIGAAAGEVTGLLVPAGMWNCDMFCGTPSSVTALVDDVNVTEANEADMTASVTGTIYAW